MNRCLCTFASGFFPALAKQFDLRFRHNLRGQGISASVPRLDNSGSANSGFSAWRKRIVALMLAFVAIRTAKAASRIMSKFFQIIPAALAASAWLLWPWPCPAQTNLVNVTNIGLGPTYGAAVFSHYLYVATASGLRILDISNPANPVDVGYSDSVGFATGVAASGQYLYDLHSDVSVLDIANPPNPVAVGHISGNWQYVTALGQSVYLFAGGGVTMYNVPDPANPREMGTGGPVSCGYAGAVSGNYAYVAGCYSGLLVYDLSEPLNFKQAGEESGGVFAFAVDAAVAGKFAYLASYTNALRIFNVSNPTNPILVSMPSAYGNSVALSGNYAYVAGSGGASIAGWPANLFVVDVSNPTNATVVASSPIEGFVDFYDRAHRLEVSGSNAYMATDNGLAVFSLGVPAPPQLGINLSSTNTVLVCWPAPNPAFAVQENPDLNPAHWTTLTNTSFVVGSQNQVTLPNPPGTMFYRLAAQ